MSQIVRLYGAGADIVRVTINNDAALGALPVLVERSPVPIVADVHFRPNLAIGSILAGADCVRLDPGNLHSDIDVARIVDLAGDRDVTLRIGINSGSIDPAIVRNVGPGHSVEVLVRSAEKELSRLEKLSFRNFKMSVKSSNIAHTLQANRIIADLTDAPLHIGLTEAGPGLAGIVKCTAAIAPLLMSGIGDTIRFSLTQDPEVEVRCGRTLVDALAMAT